MKKLFVSCLTVAFSLTSAAQSTSLNLPANLPNTNAEGTTENTTSVKKDSLLVNKKYEDDKTLTDPALRSLDGSLSRYSFKGAFKYNGPGLGDLSNPNIPRIDNVRSNNATKMVGSVTGNLRVDSVTSWSFGTGFSLNHPFNGADSSNASNPFIAWNQAYRMGGLELRTSPSVIASTDPIYTSVGEYGGLNWSNGAVYNFEKIRLAVSLDTSLYYWMFGRGYVAADKLGVQQYSASWGPGVKYRFTDDTLAYTRLSFGVYNPRNLSDGTVLANQQTTWETGFGWAYDRDIYLNPYIIAFPANLRDSLVTGNFSIIFSLL